MKKICIEKAFMDLKCGTKKEALEKIKDFLERHPGSPRLYGRVLAGDEYVLDFDIENPTTDVIDFPEYKNYNGILYLVLRKYTIEEADE